MNYELQSLKEGKIAVIAFTLLEVRTERTEVVYEVRGDLSGENVTEAGRTVTGGHDDGAQADRRVGVVQAEGDHLNRTLPPRNIVTSHFTFPMSSKQIEQESGYSHSSDILPLSAAC